MIPVKEIGFGFLRIIFYGVAPPRGSGLLGFSESTYIIGGWLWSVPGALSQALVS